MVDRKVESEAQIITLDGIKPIGLMEKKRFKFFAETVWRMQRCNIGRQTIP